MAPGLQAAEQAPAAKVMRDAATHDSIVEAGTKAKEEAAKQAVKDAQQQAMAFKPVPPEQRPKAPEQRSLLAVSDIICYNGIATMVPKRSVLHVPKNLKDRLVMQDGARFVTFQDFIVQNRSWLVSSEVSRIQAEGNKPLAEDVTKSFEKETRVVVATYHEGPISVLPLKVVEDPATATTTTTTSKAVAAP